VDQGAVNTKAGLLHRILSFLAPGLNGEGTLVFDRAAYTLPSLITLELADSDLAGQGQATVMAYSTTEPDGLALVLQETVRPGIFRGTLPLVAAATAPAPGWLRARNGDLVWMRYADVSAGRTIEVSVPVDTLPPVISGVVAEADYMAAFIRWDTPEPSDALVQFGESLPLPINRTAYDSRLQTQHELLLTGLLPDRDYYYQVVSRDEAGNAAVDDNHGTYHVFRTLKPLPAPWSDALETGAADWSVIDGELSDRSWELGAPDNAQETQAHSPLNAWGTNLRGENIEYCETYLFSPAVDLTAAGEATLRFWHSYDFSSMGNLDAIEGGELLIYTNLLYAPAATIEYADLVPGWTSNALNLTPYVGNVVFLAWHYYYFNLFLEDSYPPGWLVDDISITTTDVATGTVRVTNNLSQATFTLTGPTSRTGQGWGVTFTNLPTGTYRISFDPVPYYLAPLPQTNVLVSRGNLLFQGFYGFADANTNGMSDLWEQAQFGGLSPARDASTDTDKDGFPDVAEFLAGTDPKSPTSKLEAAVPRRLVDGSVQLEWATVPGRAYRVLASTNAASWQAVTDWQRASASTLTATLSPDAMGSRGWFRVEVKP
jgi:hypothetical protein